MSNYYEIEYDNRYDEEFLSKVKDGDRVKYLHVRDEGGEIVGNVENTWNDVYDRPQEMKFRPDSYQFIVYDVSKLDTDGDN